MYARYIFFVLFCLFLIFAEPIHAYRLLYREQLYELYHQHHVMYPERIAENVYWLEQALKSDFANPLYARAKIKTKTEWEWYRSLFTMHINLLLTSSYLQWGAQFMKFNAYFYNAPWQQQNLKSLNRAEELINYAQIYWEEAKRWSNQVEKVQFINLPNIQYWEDEHYRIMNGTLDYHAVITKHLKRIERVRAEFTQMDENTY